MTSQTQNRLDTLKEYLSTKTKAPEEIKVDFTKDATVLSTVYSEDKTYTKDLLKWIDNCLNQYDKVLNKKYNSAFLQIVELSYSRESLLVCV